MKAKYEKDLAAWPDKAKAAKAEGKPPPRKPRDPVALRDRKGDVGGLFNGKIAPLIPYAIRGALWYQGEANSNGTKALYYEHQLPLLVKDWRARWGYEFPFAWVQLPNFTKPGDGWSAGARGGIEDAQAAEDRHGDHGRRRRSEGHSPEEQAGGGPAAGEVGAWGPSMAGRARRADRCPRDTRSRAPRSS